MYSQATPACPSFVCRTMRSVTACSRFLALAINVFPILASNISFVPPTKNCIHGPQSRGCWHDGFNILTDYNNNSLVPPGKLVEVKLMSSGCTALLTSSCSMNLRYLNRSSRLMATKNWEWSSMVCTCSGPTIQSKLTLSFRTVSWTDSRM